MKNKFLFLLALTLLVTGCFSEPGWTYSKLPNSYQIKRLNQDEVIIGKVKDNLLETEIDNKTVGVTDYISAFQYGEKYISLKCIQPTEEDFTIIFYIIDTEESYVYGPYADEETYDAVRGKIVEEKLGDWISTDLAPKDAKVD